MVKYCLVGVGNRQGRCCGRERRSEKCSVLHGQSNSDEISSEALGLEIGGDD